MKKQTIDQPLKTKTPFFYGYIIVGLIFIFQVILFGSVSSSGVFFIPVMKLMDLRIKDY
jgi:hypothetical protein